MQLKEAILAGIAAERRELDQIEREVASNWTKARMRIQAAHARAVLAERRGHGKSEVSRQSHRARRS